MGALVLTIAASILLGCLLWLIVGPRIRVTEDKTVNEVANVFIYVVGSIVVLFPIVLFVLGE